MCQNDGLWAGDDHDTMDGLATQGANVATVTGPEMCAARPDRSPARMGSSFSATAMATGLQQEVCLKEDGVCPSRIPLALAGPRSAEGRNLARACPIVHRNRRP